jgi:hypothetical protein
VVLSVTDFRIQIGDEPNTPFVSPKTFMLSAEMTTPVEAIVGTTGFCEEVLFTSVKVITVSESFGIVLFVATTIVNVPLL